jgi:hypothetical protein
MLLLAAAQRSNLPIRHLQKRHSASPMILFQRQDPAMTTVMKERWTEAEVAALPTGEHDYFDRKSGALLSSPDFRKDMGKALSAFANSGGGHLVLGVQDDGAFDGVDKIKKGRVTSRDWLEQTIPNLTVFPLQQFRVHEIEASSPSTIPSGKVLIVVDVGDSTMAPHQAEDSKIYYYRQAGRSLPAPHFYLETLRNRLIAPLLEAELIAVQSYDARTVDESIFLELNLEFTIRNIGGVAAYKKYLAIDELLNIADGRNHDYLFDPAKFPPKTGMRHGSIPLDTTILPSLSVKELKPMGLFLRPQTNELDAVIAELSLLLSENTELRYRVVSELSRGETRGSQIATFINARKMSQWVLSQISSV